MSSVSKALRNDQRHGAGAHVCSWDLATSPQKSHLGLCRVRTRRGSKAGEGVPSRGSSLPGEARGGRHPAPGKGGDEPPGDGEEEATRWREAEMAWPKLVRSRSQLGLLTRSTGEAGLGRSNSNQSRFVRPFRLGCVVTGRTRQEARWPKGGPHKDPSGRWRYRL